MCSSRLEPDGRVVVTAPSEGCPSGTVFYVVGSPAEARSLVSYGGWLDRLIAERNGNGAEAATRRQPLQVL